MLIHFSKAIGDKIDIKEINSDLLDIYVRPSLDPYSDIEDEPILWDSYNLTWKPISFEGKDLIIDVDFHYPKSISTGIE